MRRIPENLIGRRFGRLTVVGIAKSSGFPSRWNWKCRCDCGNYSAPPVRSLLSGETKSCGCLQKEIASNRARTHGRSGTSEYSTWQALKDRHLKGIIHMDPQWVDDAGLFMDYMGPRPTKRHRVHLHDPDAGYIPGNVEWREREVWTKDKEAEAHRRWKQKNPDRDREYRQRNLERTRTREREAARRKKLKDPEGQRRKLQEWYQNNPGARAAHSRQRRARAKGADGSHTAQDIRDIFELQNGKCAYCRKKLKFGDHHVDHIQALSRGGRNDRANLQITCAECNMSKKARDPIEFAQSLGKLI